MLRLYKCNISYVNVPLIKSGIIQKSNDRGGLPTMASSGLPTIFIISLYLICVNIYGYGGVYKSESEKLTRHFHIS